MKINDHTFFSKQIILDEHTRRTSQEMTNKTFIKNTKYHLMPEIDKKLNAALEKTSIIEIDSSQYFTAIILFTPDEFNSFMREREHEIRIKIENEIFNLMYEENKDD